MSVSCLENIFIENNCQGSLVLWAHLEGKIHLPFSTSAPFYMIDLLLKIDSYHEYNLLDVKQQSINLSVCIIGILHLSKLFHNILLECDL